MSNTETPKKRWKTNAVSLTEYEPGNVINIKTDSEVEVRETCRSFDMDKENTSKTKLPYGIPISTELAIALISDLQHRIRKFYSAFTQFTEKLNDTDSFEKDDLDWLRDLLIHSSGITIDKNVLLKTLSQPGCEGVRFYLCRKEIPNDNQKKTPFLSLVTVAVDAEGHDLHYKYIPGKLKEGLKQAELENTSLLTEYGTPPPPYTFSLNKEEQFDERFAILMYALDESENIARAIQNRKKKDVNV